MNSYSKPPSCSWLTKMRPKLIQDKSLRLLSSCHKPGIVLSFTYVFGSWSVFEADTINFLPSLLSLALFLPGEAWFVMASKYTAYDSFAQAPRDENCGLPSFSVLLVRPQCVSLFSLWVGFSWVKWPPTQWLPSLVWPSYQNHLIGTSSRP